MTSRRSIAYQGKVRAIRAVVTKPDQEKPRTWCFAIVGERARRVSRSLALRIIRARWHIENTCFHQWTRYWNLSHIFRHTAKGPECHPVAVGAGLRSTAAVHLSPPGPESKAEGPNGYDPESCRGHASRSSHSACADSVGHAPAEHQLTPRRSRAQWAARVLRLGDPPALISTLLGGGRTRQKQTGCCTDGLVRSGAFHLAQPSPLESSVAARSGTPAVTPIIYRTINT